LPGAEELRSFYPDEYYGEPGEKFQPLVERLVRWVGERHISFLSRDLPAGARVLDVGCGRGVVLGALADRDFEVHGLEVSSEATRGVDPRARIRIAATLSEARYEAESFDEVLIWHVLEHLVDPRAVVEEIRRILRPGGRLIVAVPNFSSLQASWSGAAWFHLDLPRHLYQFPLEGLCRLLVDAGFRVDSEHHFSLRQNPFGWIQSFLNLTGLFTRNALYTLLHRRSSRHAAPFGIGTSLLLLASLAVAAPFALVLSVLGAILRSGATVHVVARKRAAGE